MDKDLDPVRRVMENFDPTALASLLASLDGDELASLLDGAMGYVKNMPQKDKETLMNFIVKDKD